MSKFSSLILSICTWCIANGAPSTNCFVAVVESSSSNRIIITFVASPPIALCDGFAGNVSINTEKNNKVHNMVINGNEDQLFSLLTKSTFVYTCSGKEQIQQCLVFKDSHNQKMKRRDVHNTTGNDAPFLTYWLVGISGGVAGIFLLSLSIICCAKGSSTNEVSLTQQTGLKIIDGPPPDYRDQKDDKTNSIKITERHHTNTMTQEARINIGQPSSPSSDSANRPSSPNDTTKVKKSQDPLPLPPVSVPERKNEHVCSKNDDDDDDDDDDKENPYDVADVIHNKNKCMEKAIPPAGTGSNGEYFEIHHNMSRMRSSTEPVEPLPPLPPLSKTRSLTTAEASHLPLPPTPVDGNNHLQSIKDDEKVYDSLDDDDNEMYESVPEDLKEELIGHSISVPVPPRSPVGTESFSSSSSPTKKAPSCPDSPQSKKGQKRANKKRPTQEDDSHKHRIPLLNRFRSNSASVVTKGTPREKRSDSSPDHTHLLQPMPPIPIPFDNDDDDDMYDSVDRDEMFEITAKSATLPPLPPGTRSSMFFNPRTAEPLPEVPEDSGSGSKAVTVTRERHTEADDPNYDIVTRPTGGKSNGNEESDEEDNYDTVKPINERLPPSAHNYAKVTTHNQTHTSVEHDDKGYAMVNPEVINKKRGKLVVTDESPYDKVKLDDEIDDESPYDKIGYDSEPEYDCITKDNVDEPLEDDEHTTDKVINEPPYDKVINDIVINEVDMEPPYDKLINDDDFTDKVINEPPHDRIVKDDESPIDKSFIKNGELHNEPCKENENSDDVNIVHVDAKLTKSSNDGSIIKDEESDHVEKNPPIKVTVKNDQPVADVCFDDDTKQCKNSANSSLNLTTNTVIDVEDTTYAQVDLVKKHESRKIKEQGEVATEITSLNEDLHPPRLPSPLTDSARNSISPEVPFNSDHNVVITRTDNELIEELACSKTHSNVERGNIKD